MGSRVRIAFRPRPANTPDEAPPGSTGSSVPGARDPGLVMVRSEVVCVGVAAGIDVHQCLSREREAMHDVVGDRLGDLVSLPDG